MSTKTYILFSNEEPNGYLQLELTSKQYHRLRKDVELHNRDCLPEFKKKVHVTSEPENLKIDQTSGTLRVKTEQEKINEALITLQDYKDKKIAEVKLMAYLAIIEVFPEWKQTNIDRDAEYAKIILGEYTGDDYAKVTKDISPKIQVNHNYTNELRTIFNHPDTVNIDDLISQIATEVLTAIGEDKIRGHYEMILKSLSGYLLIYSIRDWSNDKEDDINNCTTQAEIDAIVINDYPNIDLTIGEV